jgi:molybdopterin-guanine dinucleotide biosynthesis protein A
MNDGEAITGAILAGGRGSRMGGIDKGLAPLGDKPLIEHILAALGPQVTHLLINANRNIDRYAEYGHPVVKDRLDGHQGPLAGFAALLGACEDDWLVTVPCDTPHIPADLVQRMWSARVDAGAEIAIAHDGRRMQPAHALLPRRLLSDLEAFLDSGERKIDRWYARHAIVEVDFSDQPDAFLNLNRPEDYRQFDKVAP